MKPIEILAECYITLNRTGRGRRFFLSFNVLVIHVFFFFFIYLYADLTYTSVKIVHCKEDSQGTFFLVQIVLTRMSFFCVSGLPLRRTSVRWWTPFFRMIFKCYSTRIVVNRNFNGAQENRHWGIAFEAQQFVRVKRAGAHRHWQTYYIVWFDPFRWTHKCTFV